MSKSKTTNFIRTAIGTKRANAGSKILQKKIAEAFEPEWQKLLDEMYYAMQKVDDDAY